LSKEKMRELFDRWEDVWHNKRVDLGRILINDRQIS
jgi:hypothetical protein